MDLNCSFLETTFHFYYKKIDILCLKLEKQFLHVNECSENMSFMLCFKLQASSFLLLIFSINHFHNQIPLAVH